MAKGLPTDRRWCCFEAGCTWHTSRSDEVRRHWAKKHQDSTSKWQASRIIIRTRETAERLAATPPSSFSSSANPPRRWDDWVPQERLRKFTDDNRELAATLKREPVQPQPTKTATKPPPSSKKGRGHGSDLGSGRGSEERHSSVPAGGRGTKRGKDNDIEKVGSNFSATRMDTGRQTQGLFPSFSDDDDDDNDDQYTGDEIDRPSSDSRSIADLGINHNLNLMAARRAKATYVAGRRIGKTLPRNRGRGTPASDGKDGRSSNSTPTEEIFRDGSGFDEDRHLRRARRAGIFPSKSNDIAADEDIPVETVDEILAKSPPESRPEHMTNETYNKGLFWAPLIGGSTIEEKNAMEQELASRGLFELPERIHPGFVKVAKNDPGNLNRRLFFETQDPRAKLAIAGVADDPIHIDPPGSGSPYDALKYPDRLIQHLDRRDAQTMYGWDVEALKKIPHELIDKLAPQTLAALPQEVLIKLPAATLGKLPDDAPFMKNLPANSKFKSLLRRRAAEAVVLQETSGDGSAVEAPLTSIPSAAFTFQVDPPGGNAFDFATTHLTSDNLAIEDRDSDAVFKGPDVDESLSDSSDSEVDRLTNQAIKYLTTTRYFGLDKMQMRKHTRRADTDHLTLLDPSSVPAKWHPKPTFCTSPNVPKKLMRKRTPKQINNNKFWTQGSPVNTPSGSTAYHRLASQEETFHARPSVRIVVPDHLKNLLVDDWENVTKSLLLVPLPSKAPANFIIDTYFDEEKGKRRLGSEEADVLEEFVAGMKVYFEKAVGKTLLYRFERDQWAEIRQLWESGKHDEWTGKGPGDAYGAEHLCRLLVNMPEMIAQTNMDGQSVTRLREEISKLCQWLARNSGRFFCAKYEKPTAEYIERAR